LAEPATVQAVHGAMLALGEALHAARPDALILVGAEHFANFFMDNMPSFAMGMADHYEGPIEDPAWLGIAKTHVPGDAALSGRLLREVMQTVDLAYAEEWRFDHGLMVPLHFLTPRFDLPVVPVNINCQGPPLTPLHRAWAFGEALRRACDAAPERLAIVGTGGISHWPATPDSGKINEAWDRDFLQRWCRNDRQALLAYSDAQTYAEAGQGGFEIRTFISVAAAAGGRGELHFYQPVPIFSVGCTTATMHIQD
jgi:2,3-dihydroxyphenylpropionate 1,2-dioxygenase